MDLAAVVIIQVLYGIASLVIISAGLAVIFGMMKVINLAHGEFLMLGGYATLGAIKIGINIWIAIFIAAPLAVGVVGVILERLVIRRLYGRMIDTMLATWGLSLLLVGVQMHDKRGKNHQAYLWQYSTPGGSAVFDFRMGRGREGPKLFLGQFEGILQTDGYAAYDHTGGLKMVHAACWAHARRKVFDALKLNPDDRVARQLVERADALFRIDAGAREAGLDQVARHALRQQHSRPLLDIIKGEMQAAQTASLPSSALGKAVGYTLSLWHKLTRFLEHPELELSNNLAENSMRGVALGRKNWIHVGSEQAGPKVAAILSVMESCRRLKLPVREYLAAVLPGLANLSIQRVGAYTPAAWAASRS
jgi:transposase